MEVCQITNRMLPVRFLCLTFPALPQQLIRWFIFSRGHSSPKRHVSLSFSDGQDRLQGGLMILITTLYAITFLIGFVGNSLGLYIICKKCGIKAATHLLIANLACSNLFIVFIVIPMSVSFLYNGHVWLSGITGTITCKISQYLFVFPIATSILTILVVSIDRFFAVCHPMRGELIRKPKVMTATIWVCAAIVTSPVMVIFKAIPFQSPDEIWSCTLYFGEDPYLADTLLKVYYTSLFVLLYLLPLLIITVLYTIIGYKLYHRSIPGMSRVPTYRDRVERSKRKVAKVMVMIVTAFAICWFPAHFVHYFITFQKEAHSRIPLYAISLLLWITHSNSAIDPFLYILLSHNFRREFRKMINQCNFYERKARFERRLSRISVTLSRRNVHAHRTGSTACSFRGNNSRKVDKYAIPEGPNAEKQGSNMRNGSLNEHHPVQQNLQDHEL